MEGSEDDPRAATIVAGSEDAITRDASLASGGEPAALPDAPPPPEVGRYRLVARLGAGAMGVVWSAVDPQLERKVAIKLVHPRLASSPEASGRMLREARAMAKLSHRGVVTVHDAGEADGRLFLAMELIDGETLTARLRRPDLARPSAWRARLALVLEAGRGLAAAHAAGVLHRDFKPDNVLVAAGGRVAVGDFGLATLGEPAPTRASRVEVDGDLTMTGALLGTPAYMSPQQLRGEPADARADQFAFCVTAYEALYGTRPFRVTERGLDALPALADAIESAAFSVAEDVGVGVPAAVRDVLRRGLAADPAARWPDLDSLLVALDTASGLRARRRRRGVLAASALAFATLAAGAGAYLRPDHAPPGRAEKRPMFRVPADAAIALGPGGRSIAVAFDHIEVHDPDGAQPLWTLAIPADEGGVYSLELQRDVVHYSTMLAGDARSWRFRETTTPAPATRPARSWLAHFGDGDLYVDGHSYNIHTLIYVRDGRDDQTWPFSFDEARLMATSPDREKLAVVQDDGAGHEMLAILAPDGSTRRSAPFTDITAVAWLDRNTLLVAQGTQVPSISTVAVTDHDFGAPHPIWSQPTGWFMRLVSRDGRIVFVDASPSSRVRVFTEGVTDHEPAKLSAELGWLGPDELLVWNRSSGQLFRARDDGSRSDVGIELPGEPVNATFAGDVLIASVRSAAGRDAVAYDLHTGARRWSVPATLWAVRCAEDRAPPCVAILADRRTIVDVDAATGVLGKTRATSPGIEDVALRADGHFLVAGRSTAVLELDAEGQRVGAIETAFATLHSVATTPGGGLVLAGTIAGTTYAVDRVEGGVSHRVAKTANEIMLLARASTDGSHVAVIGRTYSTELSDLVIP